MKVYERLAQAFAAEGTRTVFGMMGDGNMYWLHALHKHGVKIIEVRHEGSGLGMADGWARATHDVGVATATNGPGVSQLATALLTAARAASPLVAFVGESPTADDEHAQGLDQSRFAEACEAGFVRLNAPDQADEAVRRAFYLAKTESRPVLLSCPMDTQQKPFEDDDPYTPTASLLPTLPVAPHPAAIEQAVDLLAGSTHPVIILGRGAIWSNAAEAALTLAERTGALIATTLQAKTLLSEYPYHAGIAGLYSTRTAMHLFEDTDVVVGVGASLNRYTTEHGYLFPSARYIHLDVKPHRMMSHGRAADVYVHTDARLGVEALDAELAKRGHQNAGYHTANVQEKLVHQHQDPSTFEVEADRLDPREICATLDELLPTDITLLTGSGASSAFPVMLMNRPRKVLSATWYGCIGQSLPAAMGAIEALGRPAVLLDGDASTLMHFIELETAVRECMPLLTVVLNDQLLGAEYHKFEAHKMDPELAAISTPDLGAVMRAIGGKGSLVRSIPDLRSAVEEWVANPVTTVIDARISRKVLSVPFRRVHFGQDI